MIKAIYGKILNSFRLLKWGLTYKRIKEIDESLINLSREFFNGSFVIAPHADDELLGCFSILKSNRPFVFLCSLTGTNPSEENKNRRENEFCECVKLLECDHWISRGEIEKELAEILNEKKPSFIFIPTYIDWHAEHRLIGDILYSYINEKKLNFHFKVVLYPVSVPIPGSIVNVCNDLSGNDFKEKYGIFRKVYTSQKNINIERFMFYQKHYIKGKTVEPFSVFERDEWKDYYLKIKNKLEGKDLLSLKTNINDLKFVNGFVNSLDTKGETQ